MAHKLWSKERLAETTSTVRSGARQLGIKGSSWLPDGPLQDAMALIVAKIDEKPTVDTTDTPANGEVLTYDSTSGTYKPSPSGSAPVTSVFTRTGAVAAASGDYNAGQITNTPAGNVAATTVQAAVNELDTEKATTTALTAHTGASSGAHAGTAISNTPAGGIAATTVQAALNELDTEKPPTTRAINTTAPLGGGGDFSADRTLTLDNMLNLSTTEVSVTGAITLTSTAFGKMHVCSGTSADYTVGLPAASGNAGKVIGFRMSGALTKLVTIDANASELIDGSLTRIMWAQETAILLCDGTGWIKIAGRSRPMYCKMYRNAALSIASGGSATTISLDTASENPVGMADTTNGLINIRRAGRYKTIGKVYGSILGANCARFLCTVSSGAGSQNEVAGLTNSFPSCIAVSEGDLSSGDTVTLATFQNSGSSLALTVGSAANTFLMVAQVIDW